MDSPIIILVLWFVINILIKSAKDKQKIEEAKRKRAQQLGNKPIQSSPKNIKGRSIIDALREEIEKEVNKEKNIQKDREKHPTVQNVYASKSEKVNTNKKADTKPVIDKDIKEPEVLESIENEARPVFIDMKKDILKGIIMSEILSEPKSIKNMKRSI